LKAYLKLIMSPCCGSNNDNCIETDSNQAAAAADIEEAIPSCEAEDEDHSCGERQVEQEQTVTACIKCVDIPNPGKPCCDGEFVCFVK
jgi:hypothetical protein